MFEITIKAPAGYGSTQLANKLKEFMTSQNIAAYIDDAGLSTKNAILRNLEAQGMYKQAYIKVNQQD